MSKMGLHDPFGHLKHKLWPKEGLGVNLTIWLPTTKSQESTWFPCVKVTCNMPLESSWQGIQIWSKPHFNQRSAHKVTRLQSCKSPNVGKFGTPETKNHLDAGFAERCRVYYKGEGGGFPQVWVVVSLVSPNCSWFVLAPKMLQLCTNHFVIVLCRSMWVSEACQIFLVPSRSSNTPFYASKVLRVRERAPNSWPLESIKELGNASFDNLKFDFST
jgi:hypothetical protein